MVKEFISSKGVVDSEMRNFLITGFYRQGLYSILISNILLGSSYFLSVNLEKCKFYFDEFPSYLIYLVS